MLNVKKFSEKPAQKYDRFWAKSNLFMISIYESFVPEAYQRPTGSTTSK